MYDFSRKQSRQKKKLDEKGIINKIYSLTPQIKGLPVHFISAKNKTGFDELIVGIKKQYDIWNKRISTGKLNSWLQILVKNIHRLCIMAN